MAVPAYPDPFFAEFLLVSWYRAISSVPMRGFFGSFSRARLVVLACFLQRLLSSSSLGGLGVLSSAAPLELAWWSWRAFFGGLSRARLVVLAYCSATGGWRHGLGRAAGDWGARGGGRRRTVTRVCLFCFCLVADILFCPIRRPTAIPTAVTISFSSPRCHPLRC